MRAMRLEDDWGLDNIRPVELPEPVPGRDDVVIRIEAVSINPRDLLLVQGGYGRLGGSPPIVPLCDGAGRVHAVGGDVTGFEIGELVCPAFSRTWLTGTATPEALAGAHGGPLDGTMQELMSVPASSVVKAPPHLGAAEAATLPCAAVTAWNALAEQGNVGNGDTVLIQGTGGVSLFALQFAKLLGAEVVLISSSDEKLALGNSLGANHLVNYRDTPDWHKKVRKATGGVDHIVEVGGAGTLGKSLSVIRPSGTISLIGVLGGAATELQLGRVVTQNIRLQGVTVGSVEMFRHMVAAMEQHGIRPVLDKNRFAFEELASALAALPDGDHIGKVVCTFE